MLKKHDKKIISGILFSFILSALVIPTLKAQSSWDSEKLSLEISMQRRVEEALTKILRQGEFVVVVRVEPWEVPVKAGKKSGASDEGFFLPGVPRWKRMDGSGAALNEIVDSMSPDKKVFTHFIRRVSATLVLDEEVDTEKVEKVRELTRQILGIDPKRGDTLDVQRTVFNNLPRSIIDNSSISKLQRGLKSYWLIISLALIVFCITVFLLFVFGPLRGFLNRFVQVLPTLRPQENQNQGSRLSSLESQLLPGMMAQAYGMFNPGGPPPTSPGSPNISGSLMVENPNKKSTPFGFIREDNLSNLAVLLSRENPEKAAVVLGYLPSDWISRVISKMEPAMQSEITEHLATTRQLLPEQVEDIEQDLKRRLDYLIGGPDRILAIYETLNPEGQRKMLENIASTQPELAELLRQKTFLFEDLNRVNPKHLKIVLREVDLQTLIMSLKGVEEELRGKILEALSAGKAEIVREELEFADGPSGTATEEAQRKVIYIAKKLEREGQVDLITKKSNSPSTRYEGNLGEPVDFSEEPSEDEEDVKTGEVITPAKAANNIEERIQRFMNRRTDDRERFPLDEDQTRVEPPPKED